MSDDKPLRGRQAEARRNDRLVLDAARRVFAEHGFSAPITAVAEEAGVGIGTLYRRYDGKDELLQHLCVLSLRQNLEAANEALAMDDAWEGLADYIQRCVDFGAGAFAPVAGTIVTTDEMRELAQAVRSSVSKLVTRAQRVGSLRTDVNVIDVLQLVEHFSRAHPGAGPRTRGPRARQLAIALSGLRADGRLALPAPPPTPEDYEAAWL
ncbi:MAG: TetR/AcrR family transcriptional regulator [Solirubrobacteraceae bacterium]